MVVGMAKRYLITGGAGYLGRRLVRKLLTDGNNNFVRVLAHSEGEIVGLKAYCGGLTTTNEELEVLVGDIRSTHSLTLAVSKIDTVFHLAAMKHIDICEENPAEAVATNVLATMKLLHLFRGDTFIGMSTDKAIGAIGCYGATKLLLERLVLEQARYYPNRRYIVIRSGNIFASAGSVIPKWIQQIAKNNRITVTDPAQTRFFTGAPELASFLHNVALSGENGKTYIPEMATIRLGDLASAVRGVFGNETTRMDITGARYGEKTYETLFTPREDGVVAADGVGSSSAGKCLSVAEIKDWLERYVRKDV